MRSALTFAFVAPVEANDSPSSEHFGEGRVRHFRSFFELAGITNRLVDDFNEADIILFLEPSIIADHRSYAKQLLKHPAVCLYPERCYTYNGIDRTHAILPGLYVSLAKELADPWFHSGAPHCAFPNDHVNRFEPPEKDTLLDKSRLACFRGSETCPLRRELFDAAKNRYSSAITIRERYGAFFANGEEGQRIYCEEIRDHAFSLAPAGYGPSSFRIYESMALGRVPVVIADSWMPPAHVAWHECCLIIPEKDLWNLENILADDFHRASELGANARMTYQKYFAPTTMMSYLVESLERIHLENPYPKSSAWRRDYLARAAEAIPALSYKRRLIQMLRRLRKKLMVR
jgi:Exostosin family